MSQKITAQELNKLINDGANIQLIDVREPSEFDSFKINNSINIPLSSLSSKLDTIDKNRETYIICLSGRRALSAQEILKKNNISSVVLDGGISAYKSSKYPVEKGQCSSFSIAQQVQIIIGLILLSQFNIRDANYVVMACGIGLLYTGLSGSCILGRILMLAPWNKKSS